MTTIPKAALQARPPAKAGIKKPGPPSHSAPPRPKKRQNATGFRVDESATLVNYLRNPTSTGFWRLTATRRADGKFLRYICDRKGLDVASYRLNSPSRPPAPQPNDEADKMAIAAKISTFFSAVNAAYLVRDGEDLSELMKADDHGIRSIDYFDASEVRTKFPELVDIFQAKITHPNFSSLVVKGGCFELANGTVLLLSDWNSAEITFAAVSREPVTALAEFLQGAELIANWQVERVFSPEEELLAPYFEFLKLGYDTTIRDQRLRPQLELAFEYFEKDDFTHTISTLGIIAEDYLTQITEYYLRAPCPKGSTLGQIYDFLHSRIKELLAPKPLELSALDPIYKTLSDLQKPSEEGKKVSASAIVSAMRELLNVVKADRRFYLERIDAHTKQTRRLSMFPDWLHENLMELIRNRNAASHKTRIPLGRFEALRTLYCLSALALWWREEKDKTDWSLSSIDILKAAAIR